MADTEAAMTELLQVRSVSRQFGGLQALSDVGFTVAKGQIRAIIGPNGAGKTTLLDVITGFTRPDTGDVLFQGRSLLGAAPHELPRLGVMRTFQSARLVPRLSVAENIMLGAHHMVRGGFLSAALALPRTRRTERALRERAAAVLEFLQLTSIGERPAGGLPAGTARLVEVGRVLAGAPTLMLLDEPAAGLDDSETKELAGVLQAVKASAVTMVIVEHNMDLVMSISDNVLVLDAGRPIADGPPTSVSKDPAVVTAYLGEAS
jgi:branched-chain amino acid transport system ATP-binding protein